MTMRRLLLPLALILACQKGETPAPRPAPQVPVFIISVDTLRSDRLSVYGDAGAVTPSLERLRKDSILFEHAFSHAPLTLPSHASILTGQLPTKHRVRDNGGYAIAADASTIPGILKSYGYATGAAVSSFVLRRTTGIANGFDHFDDALEKGEEERGGTASLAAFSSWLDKNRGRRNIFGFLHLFEPHAPYDAPVSANTRSGYDAEVTAADAVVGSLLDDLESRGLYRDALIIFLSDHGEGLGDHGEDEHGVFLYREIIGVPLIVKLPGNQRAGESVPHVVALSDVFPTILEVLNLPAPGGLDGQSLIAPGTPRRIYSETFFPRLHLGWSESFSMVDDTHHYIDAPRSELYRYRIDPEEKKNLVTEERRVAAAIREELETIDRALNPPSAISREEQKSFAALGYLGSAGVATGKLPDAKDRISTLRKLKHALGSFQSREYTRAASMLRPLTKEAPELVDAWTLLAEAQLQLGQTRAATETLRGAVQRFPTHPEIRPRLAEVLLSQQKFAEVDDLLKDRKEPPRRALHYQHAQALLGLGRVPEAERELRQEIIHFPDHLEAWGALAAVLAGQGRGAQAREVLRESFARNPGDRARRIARDTLLAVGDQEGLRLLGLEAAAQP
jgi:choline-sulfatase